MCVDFSRRKAAFFMVSKEDVKIFYRFFMVYLRVR
jgi:hypothetical protein